MVTRKFGNIFSNFQKNFFSKFPKKNVFFLNFNKKTWILKFWKKNFFSRKFKKKNFLEIWKNVPKLLWKIFFCKNKSSICRAEKFFIFGVQKVSAKLSVSYFISEWFFFEVQTILKSNLLNFEKEKCAFCEKKNKPCRK